MLEDNVNLEQFLKVSNYEDTVRQLDIYYGMGISTAPIITASLFLTV
jgi:hypothetical protein